MPIATVSPTEASSNWAYTALRIQSEFNKEAAALGLPTVDVLGTSSLNGGYATCLMSLYKGINTSLASAKYPEIKTPTSSLITAGWSYLAKDIVVQANTSLAYKPKGVSKPDAISKPASKIVPKE